MIDSIFYFYLGRRVQLCDGAALLEQDLLHVRPAGGGGGGGGPPHPQHPPRLPCHLRLEDPRHL
jgi:hypothetical protein